MRFATYHPAIQFLYFFIVLVFAWRFQHPVFLVLSLSFSYGYSLYFRKDSTKLLQSGSILAGVVRMLGIIGITAGITWFYACGHHFGLHNLWRNASGNYITLESVLEGASIGIRVSSVMFWIYCMEKILTTDKVIYLFGRIHPKLSLYLAIGIRMIPRTYEKGKKINAAQTCIGKGIFQGNPLARIRHMVRLLSILITWTLDHWKESSDSMRSRGYTLKGRTAFSNYRFDNRDRICIIWIFLLTTIVLVGAAFNQNTILYNPSIYIQKITFMSYIFYASYMGILLLPAVAEFLYRNQGTKTYTIYKF